MNVALLLIASCLQLAASGPANMPAWVPRDAMVAYWGRPPSQVPTTAPTGAQQMATWMVTPKAMGVNPREGRLLADIVGTLPLLGQRAHAWVLLDITSKHIPPDINRLDQMQSAWVIDSTGIEVEIDRRIRDLLATYTDADNGRIE